ncbi:glycerophosphodiester phosphodiesterase [Chryseolinea sp. Jin1]|uniref:Glycerophosphodiester phosphodiesterase n=2 Tax=Chryseolinea lacunae TaxID=2801331 RepID=A0ABS1L2A0_9BACT|nr:glycerophosphodiester phosphodiesterase [Chryseolinea lacunae]
MLPAMLRAQTTLDKQGHRGCRGLMPENTVAAMIKAMELGVTTLELDVVISEDKKVVVSHDTYMSAEISRKPDGTDVTAEEAKQILLFKMPYATIRQYDVGLRPLANFPEQKKMKAHKPLLEDLLDSVDTYARQHKLPLPNYNIEIKCSPASDNIAHPEPKEFVELVLAICEKTRLGRRYNIQSFDVRPLQIIHEKYPKVKLSYLTANAKTLAENLTTLGFTPDIYSPYYKTVNADVVAACHKQKMKIVPWTVNTKEEILQLVGFGVDGIITDYPNYF